MADLTRLRNRLLSMADAGLPVLCEYPWQVVIALESLFPDDSKEMRTAKRYGILKWAYGVDSTKKLNEGQADALKSWAATDSAVEEAAAIIAFRDKDAGQQRLL